MEFVLTLIATDPLPPLTEGIIATAHDILKEQTAEVGVGHWLHQGVAYDLPFTNLSPEMAAQLVREGLGLHQVDVVAQTVVGRRKKLLLADMDSTIIEQECLDELADFAGLKSEIAAITEQAMRGELDFASALRARVGKLSGLPATALDRTLQRLTLMPGALALVATMQKNGAPCHLVSGGFRYFTQEIAKRVGFTSERGNTLIIENGAIKGEVGLPILGKEAKLEALHELSASVGLSLDDTMAVGDGANDLPMLESAGTGVAYHAKPAVAAAARVRITHSDLRALLYLQGYSAEELIASN